MSGSTLSVAQIERIRSFAESGHFDQWEKKIAKAKSIAAVNQYNEKILRKQWEIIHDCRMAVVREKERIAKG